MQELYIHIATLLKSIIDFKTVAIWNNQIQNEQKELSMFIPAVYFTVSVNWLSSSSGVRQGEATVMVYVATELYGTKSDNIDTETAHYELVDKVYKKLAKAGFVSLSDVPDVNHDNLSVHTSTYRFNFRDDTLKRTNAAAKKLIKQSPDLLIDK
jgi:hypothetical protein